MRICCRIYLSVALMLCLLANAGCRDRCDVSGTIDVLNDSIRTLIGANYSAEDVVAYAYMNADIRVSLRNDNIFYDYTMQIINDRRFLLSFDWFVYVPKYVCESCVNELCGLLKSENLMNKVGFLIPHELYGRYDFMIIKAEVPTENLLYINGSLGIPIEKESAMFMFSLSDDYGFQNIYVPNKLLPNLTETYLHITSLKKKSINNIKPIINN